MPAGCGTSSSAHYQNRVKAALARAEMRRAAPAQDEIVALNRSRMPKRLSADQFDSQHGSLHWPTVLEAPEFDELRGRLDKLFAERALRPYKAGLGSPNCRQAKQLTHECRHKLQAMIHELSADDFITGDRFLKSLAYEVRCESVSKSAAPSYTPSGRNETVMNVRAAHGT